MATACRRSTASSTGSRAVRYRVDRQEALTRDETLDAQYGGKCYQTSLELYGSADNYCGDEPVVFALCADGHWRIVAAEP